MTKERLIIRIAVDCLRHSIDGKNITPRFRPWRKVVSRYIELKRADLSATAERSLAGWGK